jgi:hypothetical protein
MTLEQACAAGAGNDCPPDLGSAGFYDWAQRQIGSYFGNGGPLQPPYCGALTTCPEAVTVAFWYPKDCGEEFVFNATTKKLLAIAPTCNGHAFACTAASECVPNRCLSTGGLSWMTNVAGCPALPVGGAD